MRLLSVDLETRSRILVGGEIVGLAAPGMPAGSPGMEQGSQDHYNVLSFDKAGNTSIYARH